MFSLLASWGCWCLSPAVNVRETGSSRIGHKSIAATFRGKHQFTLSLTQFFLYQVFGLLPFNIISYKTLPLLLLIFIIYFWLLLSQLCKYVGLLLESNLVLYSQFKYWTSLLCSIVNKIWVNEIIRYQIIAFIFYYHFTHLKSFWNWTQRFSSNKDRMYLVKWMFKVTFTKKKKWFLFIRKCIKHK